MSIKVMSQIWECQEEWLKASRRLVLLALADNANDEGYCWPAIDTIARKSNLGRRYVIGILSELEERNYIIRTQRDGTSTLYMVVNQGSPPRSEAGFTPPVNQGSLGSEAGFTEGVRQGSPEPSINRNEPSENQYDTAAAIASFHSIDDRKAEKLYTQITGVSYFSHKTQPIVAGGMLEIMDRYKGKEDKLIEDGKAMYANWCNTISKQTGKPYSRMNPAWLDWWIEAVITPPADLRQKEPKDMTSEEWEAYVLALGEQA